MVKRTSMIRFAPFLIYAIATLVLATSVNALPDMTLRADTVYFNSTDSTGTLTIYMQNRVDSVAGYQFWIQLDRPDMVEFTGVLDTAGTLSSGWEMIHAHSLGGPSDLMVVCLADDFLIPGNIGPIAPQMAELPLVRLQFKILQIPDTMTDRIATVNFSRIPSLISFSRPNGTTIGFSYEILPDTACWHCYLWSDTTCLSWGRITGSVCDSVSITTDTIPYIDSLKFATIPGALIANPCYRTPEDLDIDGNGMALTVADWVAMIRYVVGDTNAVANPRAADANGDCRIDWGDYYFLDTMFHIIVPPEFWRIPCSCDNPIRHCCWQLRGNINSDIEHMVDLGDLSLLVAYISGQPVVLKCPDEANVNGSGIVDLADLSMLVSYLTGGGAVLQNCP